MGRRKFTDFERQIRRNFEIFIRREIRGAFSANLLERVRNRFKLELNRDPTVAAISTNSSLVGQLGLTDPAGKMSDVVEKIVNLLEIDTDTFTRSSGVRQITFLSLTIDIDDEQDNSYFPITNLASANQETTPTRRRPLALPLPYIEWLLLEGSNYVVRDAGIFQSPTNTQFSRSGQDFLMAPNVNGGRWRVPANHQGTVNDNFITRSAARANFQIRQILTTEADKVIRRVSRRRIL